MRRLPDPRLGAGLVLLVALWLAASVPAVLDAAGRVREHSTADRLGRAVDTAVVALQDERRLSVTFLAGQDGSPLATARARTDAARAELEAAVTGWRLNTYTSEAVSSVREMISRIDALAAVRSEVDARRAHRGDVLAAYRAAIDAGLSPAWSPNGPVGRAREALAEEDSLLRAALSGTAGPSDAELLSLGTLIGTRAARLGDANPAPDAGDDRLRALEGRLLLRKQPRVTAAEWVAVAEPVNALLRADETRAARAAVAATPGTIGAIVYAGLVAGVGLVCLLAVLVVARRWRPRPAPVAAAAADGGRIDLQPLLLDLHRRSQRLLHRLLRLLDGMERRQVDDEMLGELFRADHLATRARRNVEKAITLAGGAPGRQWRRPVPLGEVVRGAAAEIDDYVRVSTAQLEPAGLAGHAVTEVTHLLAELIDNAAVYSPADTRVRVRGRRAAGGGYVVTIADAGPGMSDLDLATARQVMADPEPPGGGVWWGYYAVGRFATRHDIDVRLERGPSGGLVAEAELPAGLVTDPAPAGPRPGGPPLDRVARMASRVGRLSDAAATSVDVHGGGS